MTWTVVEKEKKKDWKAVETTGWTAVESAPEWQAVGEEDTASPGIISRVAGKAGEVGKKTVAALVRGGERIAESVEGIGRNVAKLRDLTSSGPSLKQLAAIELQKADLSPQRRQQLEELAGQREVPADALYRRLDSALAPIREWAHKKEQMPESVVASLVLGLVEYAPEMVIMYPATGGAAVSGLTKEGLQYIGKKFGPKVLSQVKNRLARDAMKFGGRTAERLVGGAAGGATYGAVTGKDPLEYGTAFGAGEAVFGALGEGGRAIGRSLVRSARKPPVKPSEIEIKTEKILKESPIAEPPPREAGDPHGLARIVKGVLEFFSPGSTIKGGQRWMLDRQTAQGGIDRGEALAGMFARRYKDLSEADRQISWNFLDGKLTINEVPAQLKNTALRFKKIDTMLGKILDESGVLPKDKQVENHVRYLYQLYEKGHAPIGIDKEAFKARKELSDAYREEIGPIKDPVRSISQSILEGTRSASMARYFTKISKEPAWTFQPSIVEVAGKKMGIGKAKELLRLYDDAGDLTPAMKVKRNALAGAVEKAEKQMGSASRDYIELKGKKYGDLDGAYVHHTIADDIKPLWMFEPVKGEHVAAKFTNTIRQAIVSANTFWKMKNVALNIPTAGRNLIWSNPVQMNMSGTPLIETPKWFSKGLNSYIRKDWAHRALLKQGAFRTNFAESELKEIQKIARGWKGDDIAAFMEGVTGLGKWYGKIDDIWKLAKFLEGKSKGLTDAMAAKESMKWHMDYSLVPPAIRTLRNIPLGSPYITYQYKILPLLAESLAKRPWIVGKYQAIPYILEQQATKDLSKDEAQEYINSLPSHVRKGQVYLWPHKDGEVSAISAGYMLPWGNVYEMGASLKSGDFSELMKDSGLSMGLLPTVLFAVLMNRDLFTDQPVISELGKHDPVVGAVEITKYMWRLAMPSMVTDVGAGAKIYEHVKYGQTKKGLETKGIHAYPRMAGVNIYPIDKNAGRLELQFEKSAIVRELRKKLRDRRLSPEELEKIREVYRFAIEDIVWGKDVEE